MSNLMNFMNVNNENLDSENIIVLNRVPNLNRLNNRIINVSDENINTNNNRSVINSNDGSDSESEIITQILSPPPNYNSIIINNRINRNSNNNQNINILENGNNDDNNNDNNNDDDNNDDNNGNNDNVNDNTSLLSNDTILPEYEELGVDNFTIITNGYYYKIIYNKYMNNFLNLNLYFSLFLEIVYSIYLYINFGYIYKKNEIVNDTLIINSIIYIVINSIILYSFYKVLFNHAKKKILNNTISCNYRPLFLALLYIDTIVISNLVIDKFKSYFDFYMLITMIFLIVNDILVIIIYLNFIYLVDNRNLKIMRYSL